MRIRAALTGVFAALFGCAAPAWADTATFEFTGGEQTFTVPAGVTHLEVTAVGAHAETGSTALPGRGASVTAPVSVTPGQLLFVEVGGVSNPSTPGAATFNGGGAGGVAGGGASDIRTVPGTGVASLNSRLIVAGGGGGSGNTGGFAGGDAGSAGCCAGAGVVGGGAGTPTTGGAAGSGGPGTDATAGSLGNGGSGATEGGGGGGGGLYGGGGGGYNAGTGAGGGGGSSLVPAGGTSTLADVTVPPQVRISFTLPPPDATAPAFTAYRLSASTFIAANIGGSIISRAASKSPPVGTEVSYSLSELATVTFTIQKAVQGRKAKGKCVKPANGNETKPKCTRLQPLKGRFAHAGVPGPNSFRFTGRLNGKRLGAGRYRLVAVSKDSTGNSSAPKGVNFKIVKP